MISENHDELLRKKIESEVPDALRDLEYPDRLSDTQGRKIVSIVLGFACCAQSVGAIEAGRRIFGRLPEKWTENHFAEVAMTAVDFDDEWEYRRLLELLRIMNSKEMPVCIDVGLRSENSEIVEIAKEFQDS